MKRLPSPKGKKHKKKKLLSENTKLALISGAAGIPVLLGAGYLYAKQRENQLRSAGKKGGLRGGHAKYAQPISVPQAAKAVESKNESEKEVKVQEAERVQKAAEEKVREEAQAREAKVREENKREAEKAEADKAEAEVQRVATKKAASAAQRVAAEAAAVEKAVADKAAAEKAQGEVQRVAAAEAQRVDAEKIAAEKKAAEERVEAERVAAAEKLLQLQARIAEEQLAEEREAQRKKEEAEQKRAAESAERKQIERAKRVAVEIERQRIEEVAAAVERKRREAERQRIAEHRHIFKNRLAIFRSHVVNITNVSRAHSITTPAQVNKLTELMKLIISTFENLCKELYGEIPSILEKTYEFLLFCMGQQEKAVLDSSSALKDRTMKSRAEVFADTGWKIVNGLIENEANKRA